MSVPFGHTVVLLIRGVTGVDGYGNDVYGWARTDVTGCVIWPRTTGAELVQGQDTVFKGLAVLMPPGTDVTAVDAVEVAGLEYQVAGDPARWVSPFTGTDPGVQLSLLRVEG